MLTRGSNQNWPTEILHVIYIKINSINKIWIHYDYAFYWAAMNDWWNSDYKARKERGMGNKLTLWERWMSWNLTAFFLSINGFFFEPGFGIITTFYWFWKEIEIWNKCSWVVGGELSALGPGAAASGLLPADGCPPVGDMPSHSLKQRGHKNNELFTCYLCVIEKIDW